MDDLLYLSQFTSPWAQNLASISFARLLNVSKIWVVTTLLPGEFNVPSLVNARSIELDGNYSMFTFFLPDLRINADVERSVNFDNLKGANFTMNTATLSVQELQSSGYLVSIL